jgi:hypothetical protein
MSIVQLSNQKEITRPSAGKSGDGQIPIDPGIIRYEFVLTFRVKDRIGIFTKVMYRPLLPLNCHQINVGDGVYNVTQVEVFIDDTTIKVNLEFPEPVTNFNETVQILKEEEWHE